jgi:hypothetical protein
MQVLSVLHHAQGKVSRGELLDEDRTRVETLERVLHDPDPNCYCLVCGFACVGETDLAMDCLETVVDIGRSHGARLSNDRDLDTWRHEPRFRQLIVEMKPPCSSSIRTGR